MRASHALLLSGGTADNEIKGTRILRARESERGASMIVFTLLVAFVIVPIMGLGIDAATQYWVKARLSAAVDSAALAAARSLNIGSTADAQAIGRQYFAANFPTGTLGTTVYGGAQVGNSVTITVTPSSNQIVVSAAAQVYAPLYFMKLLHFATGTIMASAQTTRRNSNIVLVLDRSGSMNNASNSCGALVAAVELFTNQFIDGRDQLTLITFSTGASLDYGPSIYFKSGSPSINSKIDTLVCGGATSTAQALTMAYNEIHTINQPSALNVILLFTDGGANTVIAPFPIKTKADTRYDYVQGNTGTLVAYQKSSCASTGTLVGGYTDYTGSLNPTGVTGGVLSYVSAPLNQGISYPPVIGPPFSTGCAFAGSSLAYGSYNPYQARADVAFIPNPDIYGNATVGYKASDTFPSGPYVGQIRPDTPLGIRHAAANAVDFRAQVIRSDIAYGTVTYTIGLAGNEQIPMDTDFLERVANDPRASNYDPSQPQGLFALATDNASLADAFNAIASQILRISK